MNTLPVPALLPMTPPGALVTDRSLCIVLVGGFLGAGKTTALSALARVLTERGQRVGIVTNDQAAHLVDTATVRQQGFVASEVAGGCFCCRFADFVDAAQAVINDVHPDVLLCEPVGSCTDMVATVIGPLRRFYPDLSVAPFAVLLDPQRVQELLLDDTPTSLAPEAVYIFRKQVEEADEVVLNKADTLSVEETEHLVSALTRQSGKPVQVIAAVRGDGITAWAERFAKQTESVGTGKHTLREIDYDVYRRAKRSWAGLIRRQR